MHPATVHQDVFHEHQRRPFLILSNLFLSPPQMYRYISVSVSCFISSSNSSSRAFKTASLLPHAVPPAYFYPTLSLSLSNYYTTSVVNDRDESMSEAFPSHADSQVKASVLDLQSKHRPSSPCFSDVADRFSAPPYRYGPPSYPQSHVSTNINTIIR